MDSAQKKEEEILYPTKVKRVNGRSIYLKVNSAESRNGNDKNKKLVMGFKKKKKKDYRKSLNLDEIWIYLFALLGELGPEFRAATVFVTKSCSFQPCFL